MTPQQFIKEHKVAVDLVPYLDSNGKRNKPVCMLSISNAEKACSLAEYNLAQHLLTLHESARIEALERIVLNYQTKTNGNN